VHIVDHTVACCSGYLRSTREAKYHLHADTRHKILGAVLEIARESSPLILALVEVITDSSGALHVNLSSLMLILTENTISSWENAKKGLA
jgi:hypothetical protein